MDTAAPPVLPPAFAAALDAFCEHLALERDLSQHTIRAYRGDLASLFDHAARMTLTAPGELDLATLRCRSTGCERVARCHGAPGVRSLTITV